MVAVRVVLVAGFVAVTVAPAITAPALSLTVPVISPVVIWAAKGSARSAMAEANVNACMRGYLPESVAGPVTPHMTEEYIKAAKAPGRRQPPGANTREHTAYPGHGGPFPRPLPQKVSPVALHSNFPH